MHHSTLHHCQQPYRTTTTGRIVRRLFTLGTLVLVAALFGGAITQIPAAHAAPRQEAAPRSHAIAATVTVATKVILPETSIAGPGFAGTAIAWTGTDAAHHLNIRVGSGTNFPTKTILPETSPFGPAFSPAVNIRPGLPYALAWTGTDGNHSLNVEIFPGGKKLTLRETSIGAPAVDVGFLNGRAVLILAWTGTDGNHSLNVLPLTSSNGITLIPGTKTVLPQFSSDAGPSLLSNNFSKHDVWVLGWTTRTTQQLNLATAADGVHFTSELGSGLPETSATAPALLAPNGSDSCISWTGTDFAHHLNVQCTTQDQFPQFPNPTQTKTVLPETALGTQGAAFDGGGPEGTGEIAWTGTDAAHHLNVALLQGR